MNRFSARRQNWRKVINIVMLSFTGLATLLVVTPLIWIIGYVIREGLPAINLQFFTELPTPVGVSGGGIANALVGSLMTVSLGLIIAVPVGTLAGVYAATHPDQPLGTLLRFGTDVISGVPSIVMGIFAYTLIVLPQRHFSAFSGGIVLAFIMVPTIVRSTEEMIRLVPNSLREGSLALGAAEWKTSLSVILPAALNGVITGVMLAIARAAGEAAPMLFTAFGNPFMNTDFNQPVSTLPHMIFVYAIAPYDDWRAKAWATALVLITLVLLLNVAARLLVWWRGRLFKNLK
ncbi:MAG: phosphate ABC transporter permease PstA [Chloroflexi bacterium]|nr:phosphate ABC transporter permease PstA [Chloroflexota bacterium]